jgi:hypothetical protein
MKKPALVAALLLATSFAHADGKHADSPKEKDIRHLLQLTGAAQMGAQVMRQLLDTFKTTMPNVPASFWPELQNELNADELVEKVIPVYDKQLSQAEIRDLLKFYESPTGKKLIKVTPAITQESMEIGKIWGREMSEKVMRKLEAQQKADKK